MALLEVSAVTGVDPMPISFVIMLSKLLDLIVEAVRFANRHPEVVDFFARNFK